MDRADLIAIGSLLDRLIEGSVMSREEGVRRQQEKADSARTIHVWGTGLLYPYEDVSSLRLIRPVRFHAVRGELTRRKLEEITGSTVRCCTGDPGLLAPLLLRERPAARYALGIIPHYAEYGLDAFADIQRSVPDSVLIDMTGEPLEVLAQIAACEQVISTSLHGLIVADALRIPNRWCKLTDRILGNGYKYRDYYSGYGVRVEAFDLRNGFPSLYDIRDQYPVSDRAVHRKQLQLIDSFPWRSETAGELRAVVKHTAPKQLCRSGSQ